jgi:hypothetical protein
MKRFWLNLWKDDCGALLATEWVVLASIIVLGVVPGLIAIRNGLLHEMNDVSNATMSLDQSYEFTGNELIYKDRFFANDRQLGHKVTGNGSITDIFVDANNRHAGSATIVRRDVRGVNTDAHDSKWRQPRIARTAGSAFIQGNHTADGRDVQTGTKPVEIKEVEPETAEVVPAAGRN